MTQFDPHAANGNATAEQIMQVEDQRIAKLDSPLLVIGLGGTGIQQMKAIRELLGRRYELDKAADGTPLDRPLRTQYLAIDTDATEQGALPDTEFCELEVQGLAALLQSQNALPAYETAWLDPKFNNFDPGSGAGGIRQASRIMLSRNYPKVANMLRSALTAIRRVGIADAGPGRTEIVICAGLSGGTGSGTFLDIPQIIRHLMAGDSRYHITGYLVMPDATFAMNPAINAEDHATLRARAYAALKELDFWQTVGDSTLDGHHTPYTVRYDSNPESAITWSRKPYDACVLLSSSKIDGAQVDNSGEELKRIVAENLLHYLADEVVDDGQFSYIKHEVNVRNLQNGRKHMAKTPLNYGYRAIGAYSMSIPKRKIFAYQVMKLFDTFMPEKNSDGTLGVNAVRLIHNEFGTKGFRFFPLFATEMNEFVEQVLPEAIKTDPNDSGSVETLQQGTAPHLLFDAAWAEGADVHGKANARARDFLERAWADFVEWAGGIIAERQEGPYALERYLTDETSAGYMPNLVKQIAGIEERAKKARTDKMAYYSQCKDTYENFVRPPWLARQRAINAYMEPLYAYYVSVVQEQFFKNYVVALHALRVRIENFVSQALKPMNRDLLQLREEFKRLYAENPNGADELVPMASLAPRIDLIFKHHNEDKGWVITSSYMKSLAEMVTSTVQTQDERLAYVDFTYRRLKQANGHYRKLKDNVDKCYANALDGSMDALLKQVLLGHSETDVVDPNAAEVVQLLEGKFQSLINSATPMFALNRGSDRFCVDFTYMSYPKDSELIRTYLEQHEKAKHMLDSTGSCTMDCKPSAISDRIFCLYTVDGISLAQYAEITKCEAAYRQLLGLDDQNAGLHLVRTRNQNRRLENDWSLLPSPAPFYFAGRSAADHLETEEFQATCTLFQDAVDCGMITVDESKEKPVYTVNLFYTDGTQSMIRHPEDLMSQIDGILNTKTDPVTRRIYSVEEIVAKLQALRDEASCRAQMQKSCAIDVLREYCRLSVHEPLNPHTKEVKNASRAEQETAQRNFHTLAMTFGATLIAMDPALKQKIEAQLPVFQRIKAEIGRGDEEKNRWEKRIAFADTCAELMLQGVTVRQGPLVLYKAADGQNMRLYDLNAGSVSPDLKQEMPFVMLTTCCYLADSPEGDPVLAELMDQLEAKRNAFVDRQMNGQVPKEEYLQLVARAELLQKMIEMELNQKKVARTAGGDRNLLDRQIALLQKMSAFMSQQAMTYNSAVMFM